MRNRSIVAAVTAAVVLAAAAAAFALFQPAGAAAVDPPSNITLAIQGLTPEGQPMDLSSYSWGVSKGGKPPLVNVSDLHVTKSLNALSPAIVGAVESSQSYASATLVVTDPTPGSPTFTYALTGVTITSDQHSGSNGSGTPMESVSIHANDVDLTVS